MIIRYFIILFFLSISVSRQLIPIVETYENGNIKYKGNFKNGKRHGAGKEFYLVRYLNSGYSCFRKIFEGHYKNGKLHGKGKFYNKNGNVKFKGQFKNGFF